MNFLTFTAQTWHEFATRLLIKDFPKEESVFMFSTLENSSIFHVEVKFGKGNHQCAFFKNFDEEISREEFLINLKKIDKFKKFKLYNFSNFKLFTFQDRLNIVSVIKPIDEKDFNGFPFERIDIHDCLKDNMQEVPLLLFETIGIMDNIFITCFNIRPNFTVQDIFKELNLNELSKAEKQNIEADRSSGFQLFCNLEKAEEFYLKHKKEVLTRFKDKVSLLLKSYDFEI